MQIVLYDIDVYLRSEDTVHAHKNTTGQFTGHFSFIEIILLVLIKMSMYHTNALMLFEKSLKLLLTAVTKE